MKILVAVLVAGLAHGDGLALRLVTQPKVEERLKQGLVKGKERQAVIARMFDEVGCKVELQQVDKRSSNVICRLQGETNELIVVGAHYDFVDVGRGIVDDWSGVALLPSLYESLKTAPRKHSYEFVAFTGEEVGLVGSGKFVRALSEEQRVGVVAFVNLECLGLTPPKVWTSRANPELLKMLQEVAGGSHIPLQGVNVEQVGDDDSHPFLAKKIPVITIHSVTQETIQVLHSAADDMRMIHEDEYYEAYELAGFYLVYLDLKLGMGRWRCLRNLRGPKAIIHYLLQRWTGFTSQRRRRLLVSGVVCMTANCWGFVRIFLLGR
jgi:putative aminopeptidase FrvX